MRQFFKSKVARVVGIDFNRSAIHLVEMSHPNGCHQIEGLYSEIIAPVNLNDSETKNSQLISAAIRHAVEEKHIRLGPAVVAVSDEVALTQMIPIHKGLSLREMEELIQLEMNDSISQSRDDISIDFQVIGPSLTHSTMLDVLVVVVRTEKIRERINVIEQAGFRVKVVELESHAISRLMPLVMSEMNIEKADQVIALVDIDFFAIRVLVLQGRNVVFRRAEEFVSRLFMDAVMQPHSFLVGSFHEDEQGILQDGMLMIIQYVQRILHVFFSTGRFQFIDGIILSGCLARLPQLVEVIQKKIGVMTRIADPLRCFELNHPMRSSTMENHSASMMLACGLALRHVMS